MEARSLAAAARLTAAAALVIFAACAQAPFNERVLVVYNADEPESKQLASYYMAKRSIPAANSCKINVSSKDQIKKDEYDANVKRPIQKCLDKLGKDNILYIVFSYETPWLLEFPPPQETYALDQFIADPYDEFLPERATNQSEVQPYFGRAQSEGDLYEQYVPFADYRKQASARHIYSVWRLDAASAPVAKGLIDKALEAEAHGLQGNGCFDRRTDPTTSVPDWAYGAGDWDIHQAAEFARRAGFPVIEDGHAEEFGTAPARLRCDHAALYAGWYALNHYNDAFSWNPGAIGIHLDSASATNPRGGTNWAAGAIAHGITVTAGATTEPYLDNLPHPDQIFWYLFHGANVGDAFLRGERLLKWRIINVGDPLYHPFSKSAQLDQRMKPKMVFAVAPQLALGDSASAGVIALAQPAAGGETFSLKSDHPDLVSLPQTVTVPQGQDGVKFPIKTAHVTADGSTVRISVISKDLQKSNTLILFSLLQEVEVSQSTIKGGASIMGEVVFRRGAQSGDAAVTLKTSNSALASVQAEIKIADGQNKAQFPIATHSVVAQTPVVISASYAGTVRSANITLLP